MRSQYSGHVISVRPIRGQYYLEPSALVSKLPDSVEDQVHDLLADGVVASGEVQVFTKPVLVSTEVI